LPEPDASLPASQATTIGLGSRALRNTALILGARVISRLIALVTVFATAGYLLPSRFGDFNTVVTVTALVAPVFVDLGFNVLFYRIGYAWVLYEADEVARMREIVAMHHRIGVGSALLTPDETLRHLRRHVGAERTGDALLLDDGRVHALQLVDGLGTSRLRL